MVTKSDLLTAAQAIEEALMEFVHHRASAKVYIFETDGGHLRALVGDDGFKGVSLDKRQDLVWNHLRKRVDLDHLAHLYGVHPMDLDEYDAHTEEM